jgi:hypothetical protein
MVNNYAKATGMDKTSLELLMQQETALTPEQCVEFGFASEIVTNAAVAVALIKPKTPSPSSIDTMKEEISKQCAYKLRNSLLANQLKPLRLTLQPLTVRPL